MLGTKATVLEETTLVVTALLGHLFLHSALSGIHDQKLALPGE
jgi:hypothetical protein